MASHRTGVWGNIHTAMTGNPRGFALSFISATKRGAVPSISEQHKRQAISRVAGWTPARKSLGLYQKQRSC
jgi:hypothetical protein